MLNQATISGLASLSLPVRRRLLRTHWAAEKAARRLPDYGIDDALIHALRLPAAEARRINLESVFHDRLQMLEWFATSRRSEAELTADDRYAKASDPLLFERLSATGAPVILAPLHMGVYSIGIMHLVHRYFRGRRLLILRAREDHETDTAAMRRLTSLASEFRFLNIRDKADFMPAMRFARDGGVVICFVDLPPSYGNPADVTLFQRRFQIALGIDAIARILDGVVVPVAVSSSVDGDVVRSGQPFDVADGSARERNSIALRISADIQRFVHDDPAQWHMWGRLHEFEPPADDALGDLDAVA